MSWWLLEPSACQPQVLAARAAAAVGLVVVGGGHPAVVPDRVRQVVRLRVGPRLRRNPRLPHDQVLVGMLEKISRGRLVKISQALPLGR